MEIPTSSPKTLFFLIPLVLAQLIFTTVSQPDFFFSKCSDEEGNYSNNSPFKKNLDKALASISTKSSTQVRDYGFYNASSGEDPDRANVKALCRGGVPLEQCRICVSNSVQKISQNCPAQKEGAGWYGDCQILYSNNSINGEISVEGASRIFFNINTAPDAKGFNEALRELLDGLRVRAASGTSIRKSAGGDVKLQPPNLYTIYGLVDCFPDMSFFDCDVCLSRLQSNLPSCCSGSIGARLVATSCQINYEIHPLYESLLSPPPTLPPTPSTQGVSNKKTITTTIISVALSTLSLFIIIIILLIFWRKRRRNQKLNTTLLEGAECNSTDEIISIEMLQFDFETIKLGTNEFSSENKIGQGGFGAVYKGKLPNGRQIAVKRLAKDSQQGDVEFRNEVLLVAKLHHRNLVRLLGFCLQKNERLLIYEFVQNASLDHFVFDFERRALLDWERRYKIINGIARGLLYLHEESRLRIIHRDLKASNILLDEKMNPKIADFGTARMFEVDETQGNTNRIVGTYGYMAPEYALNGQFSVKSDVFSFGVLVLEIISGQKNICFRNGQKVEDLSSFAWKNWRAGTPANVIDLKLTDGSRIEMVRCIHIGLLCVQENAVDRPTMASVVLMLSSFSLTLPVPSEPAFFMHSNIDESNALSSKPDGWLGLAQSSHPKSTPLEPSQNEISISELHPR